MKQLIKNILLKYINENNLVYYQYDQFNISILNINTSNLTRSLDLYVSIDEDNYTLTANYPFGVDPRDKKAMFEMTKYIYSINTDRDPIYFMINPETGEIKFDLYVNCKQNFPTYETVENKIKHIIKQTDLYGNGFLRIIFENMNAEDAYDIRQKDIE